MELGEQIATLREGKTLTQVELAEKANISPSTLSQIESGRVPRPHVGTVRKIARALGVEPAELRKVNEERKREDRIDAAEANRIMKDLDEGREERVPWKREERRMRVAYVAGRYRAPTVRGIVENIRRAEEVALELWRLGFAVICPHKNSALFDGACDDSVWLAGSLELMRRSDIVVLVPGWEDSPGTLAEVAEAESIMPVYEWPGDLDRIRDSLGEGGRSI